MLRTYLYFAIVFIGKICIFYMLLESSEDEKHYSECIALLLKDNRKRYLFILIDRLVNFQPTKRKIDTLEVQFG